MLKKQQREIPIRSVSGFEDGLLIFVKNGEISLVRSKNEGTGIAVSASNLTSFMCCNPASRHTVGSLCANNLVK